jgi:hypothetical protein
MANEEPLTIELERSDQLKQTQILEHATFYTIDNSVSLLLNHQYNQKNIVTTIDIKDWNKSREVFETELRRRGIKKGHILDAGRFT